MKKITLLTFVLLLAAIPASRVEAGKWRHGNEYYTAGNCYMVDSQAMADDQHVYTLNPDHTFQLNYSYVLRWGRNARCDELQFHVDHNTPLSRLNAWLDEVAFGWYSNLSASHFNRQTISTSRHEWFYVDENGIHRIPDWLTGLSWGLLVNDRLSIPIVHTEAFYEYATISNPLNYYGGSYVDEINDIWQDGNRDYSNLPTSMVNDINSVNSPVLRVGRGGSFSVFTNCAYLTSSAGDPYGNLLDWSWMQHNLGCSD